MVSSSVKKEDIYRREKETNQRSSVSWIRNFNKGQRKMEGSFC